VTRQWLQSGRNQLLYWTWTSLSLIWSADCFHSERTDAGRLIATERKKCVATRRTSGAESNQSPAMTSESADDNAVQRRKTNEDLIEEVVRRHGWYVPLECLQHCQLAVLHTAAHRSNCHYRIIIYTSRHAALRWDCLYPPVRPRKPHRWRDIAI